MIRDELVLSKQHIENCIDYYMLDEINNIETINILKEMRITIGGIIDETDKATQD